MQQYQMFKVGIMQRFKILPCCVDSFVFTKCWKIPLIETTARPLHYSGRFVALHLSHDRLSKDSDEKVMTLNTKREVKCCMRNVRKDCI